LTVFRTKSSVPAALFAAVLEALGFKVARHAARVVLFGPLTEAKRTHVFMTVAVGGATYVADPGFGPFAPRYPVPLVDSSPGQTTTGCSATATSGCSTSRGETGSL
jgi:arylamine N-acetyltransferase